MKTNIKFLINIIYYYIIVIYIYIYLYINSLSVIPSGIISIKDMLLLLNKCYYIKICEISIFT